MGIPIVTTIRATMSPRRLRSSMNRVAIMPPVGIHDPRWSRGATLAPGIGPAPVRQRRTRSSFRGPQSARDLQEPRFERGLHRLEPVDRDPALDEDAGDLGDDVASRSRPAR